MFSTALVRQAFAPTGQHSKAQGVSLGWRNGFGSQVPKIESFFLVPEADDGSRCASSRGERSHRTQGLKSRAPEGAHEIISSAISFIWKFWRPSVFVPTRKASILVAETGLSHFVTSLKIPNNSKATICYLLLPRELRVALTAF